MQLLVGKIHLFRNFPDPLVDFRLLQLLDLQAEGDIVVNRHGGEQGIALEHDADIPVLDGHVGNVPVLDPDGAGNRVNKAGNGAQSGGLSAARGAKEGKELPLAHIHIDIVQGLKVPESDQDIVELDHFLIHAAAPFLDCWLLFRISNSRGKQASWQLRRIDN